MSLPPIAGRGIRESARDDLRDLLLPERLQDEHAAPREQRRDDLEARILGRRADEHDRAVLDEGKERVLLRLVEAMDLVDEEDRSRAVEREARDRLRRDALDVRDPGRHGGEELEVRVDGPRDEAREGRLAAAGRAPEDERGFELPVLEDAPEDLPFADEILLADELVEAPRTHPLRQGRRHIALEEILHGSRVIGGFLEGMLGLEETDRARFAPENDAVRDGAPGPEHDAVEKVAPRDAGRGEHDVSRRRDRGRRISS